VIEKKLINKKYNTIELNYIKIGLVFCDVIMAVVLSLSTIKQLFVY